MKNRELYAGHFTINLSGLTASQKRRFKRHLYGLEKKGVFNENYRFETTYDNLVMFSVVGYRPDNPNDRDSVLEARNANQEQANRIKEGMQTYIDQFKK